MSPTVFRMGNYRFYFFSREEERMHVHVVSPDGECKFWIEPEVKLALSKGLNEHKINEIEKIIKERVDDIKNSWQRHFGG